MFVSPHSVSFQISESISTEQSAASKLYTEYFVDLSPSKQLCFSLLHLDHRLGVLTSASTQSNLTLLHFDSHPPSSANHAVPSPLISYSALPYAVNGKIFQYIHSASKHSPRSSKYDLPPSAFDKVRPLHND